MDLLIISADSKIGAQLLPVAREKGLTAYGTTRQLPSKQTDLLPFDLRWSPLLPVADTTVLCSGVNGFKACQEDPEGARFVNVECTSRIASYLASRGGKLILLSSCAAETHPETVYGALKLETEKEILRLGGCALRFGPVAFAGRAVYPNKGFQPIELDDINRIVLSLCKDHKPGLHRIMEPKEWR